MFFFRTHALLFQLILTSAADVSPPISRIGRITGGLYVYAGEMLQLFCVLEATGFTAHNISFSVIYPRGKDATQECLHVTNVHVHNASTAVLSIPNFYVNKTGIAHFKCLVDFRCTYADATDTEMLVDSVDVRIQYRPQNITNFTCVVFNWENLNCTWQHPVQYNVDLNDTQVSLVFNSDQSLLDFNKCPQPRFDGCFWSSITTILSFKIVVSVKNCFTGDTATTSFNVETYKIVKPAQVEYLSLTKQGDQEGCYLLSWQQTKTFDAVCQVFYKRPENTEYELRQDNITKTGSIICELRPNTLYKFFVQCYPGGNFSGYWSDKTYIKHFTPEAAPSTGPETTNGSYIFSASCINDLLNVTIFWKDVIESARNGVITKYIIKHKGRVLIEVDNNSYSATVDIPCNALPTNLEIAAVNSAGESTNPSIIRVAPLSFQVSLQIRKSFAIALNGINTKPRALWNQTEDNKNSHYTVFWCIENRNSPCKGPINWMHVPRFQFYLVIPELSKDAMYYNFGIARRDDESGITTGLHWTDCLFYPQPASLPSPAIVNVQPDTESAIVFWQKIECTKKTQVFLTGYRVMWCQRHKCNDSSSIQNVDLAATLSSFKVSSLEANTIYKVAVLGKVHDHLGQVLFWKEVTPKPAGSIVLTIVGSIIAVVSLVFITVAWVYYRRCQISRKRTKEIQIEDSHPHVQEDEQTIKWHVPDSPSAVQQKVDDSSDSRSDTDKKAKKVEMAHHNSRTTANKILSKKLNRSVNDVSDLYEMDNFHSRGLSPKPGISLASVSTEQSQEPMPPYTRIAANSFGEGEKNRYKQQEVSTGAVDTNMLPTVMTVLQNVQVAEMFVGSNERKSLQSDHVDEYVTMEQGEAREGMLPGDASGQRISGLSLVQLDPKLPSYMGTLPLHSRSERTTPQAHADVPENIESNLDRSENVTSNPVIGEFENNVIEALPSPMRSSCLNSTCEISSTDCFPQTKFPSLDSISPKVPPATHQCPNHMSRPTSLDHVSQQVPTLSDYIMSSVNTSVCCSDSLVFTPTGYMVNTVLTSTGYMANSVQTQTDHMANSVPTPTGYMANSVPTPTGYMVNSVPTPTDYMANSVQTPTGYMVNSVPTSTDYVANSVPASTDYMANSVPTPTGYMVNSVPTPTGYMVNSVPTSTDYMAYSVPTSTGYMANSVPTSTDYMANSVSTSTGYMANSVPTPTDNIAKSVPTSTDYMAYSVPTSTGYMANSVPTSTDYMANSVSTLTGYMANSIPTTTDYMANSVPTSTDYIANSVPTSTDYMANSVPTSTDYMANSVPTSTDYMANSVPTPIDYMADSVPTSTDYIANSVPSLTDYIANSVPS